MKILGKIVLILMLLALCLGGLSAQTTCSASQTVTFGVLRVASQSIAASFSEGVPDAEAAVSSSMPLKVTVGSDASAEEFKSIARNAVVKRFRNQQKNICRQFITASETQDLLRINPAKSVITVTE
jgi:hypothetical protein